ncbi:hypothetical protein ACHAXT_003757 [Thalassiosira profunda]
MGDDHDDAGATTNAHDLAEAAKLQARLVEHKNKASASVASSANEEAPPDAIPAVSLAEGAYKYVLITAVAPSNNRRTFVYSKRNASYHRNVAEHLVPQLESGGYSDIRITGGGRILRDDEAKKVHIFGYSYGFGRADHERAKDVVEKSVNYRGYTVTW